MKHSWWRSVMTVALTLWLLGAPAGAVQTAEAADPKASTKEPEASTDKPEIEEQALAVFNRQSTFLSQAQSLSVTADTGYDAVQPSGLKVEFGAIRKYTLRRPDRVRIDTDTRDGNHRGFRFDGKEIGVFDTKEKVYATAERSGTIDRAFDYFVDQLQMPLPLSEVFATNLPKLARNFTALYYVEETTIAGVRCDHLVGQTNNVDFQLWVAQGDKPLPQRLIITYKRDEGAPQFWAQFSQWNLSPDVPDSLFAFTPPEGAEKIPFAPRKTAMAETTKQKGGSR